MVSEDLLTGNSSAQSGEDEGGAQGQQGDGVSGRWERWGRRWLALVFLAALGHAALLVLYGVWANDRAIVKVVGIGPVPGTPLYLADADRIDVEVTLGQVAEGLDVNLLGARLLYMDDPRGPQLVAVGQPDPSGDKRKLRLKATARAGRFRVLLASGGAEPLVDGGFVLDGEFVGKWPSGDGQGGGDLVYEFEVLDQPPPEPEETLVAQIIEEEPTQESSSSSGAPIAAVNPSPPPSPPELTPPAPPTPTPPPIPKPKTTRKSPVKKAQASVEPPSTVPPPLPDETSTEPAPLIPAQDLVKMNPLMIEDLIGEQASLAGDLLDQQARESGMLGDWQGRLDDVKSAFSGEGPAVQPGNQQAVSTHTAEITAYLAMIHKLIHNQWADGYLISLDLMQRDPSSPLNNPGLETVVELEIAPSGRVAKVRIVKSSGVSMYDAEAVRTARNSGPGQPTPREMRSPDGNAYVHWSFWRDQRQCGAFGASVFVLDGKGQRSKVKVDDAKLQSEEAKLGLPTGRPGANGPIFGGNNEPHNHNHGTSDPLPTPPAQNPGNGNPGTGPKITPPTNTGTGSKNNNPPTNPPTNPPPANPDPPKTPKTPIRPRPPRPPRPPVPGLDK